MLSRWEGGCQHAKTDHQGDHQHPPGRGSLRPCCPGAARTFQASSGGKDAGPEGRDGAGVADGHQGEAEREQQESTRAAQGHPPRTWRGRPGCCRTSEQIRQVVEHPQPTPMKEEGWPLWRRRGEGARHRPGFDHRAQRLEQSVHVAPQRSPAELACAAGCQRRSPARRGKTRRDQGAPRMARLARFSPP